MLLHAINRVTGELLQGEIQNKNVEEAAQSLCIVSIYHQMLLHAINRVTWELLQGGIQNKNVEEAAQSF